MNSKMFYLVKKIIRPKMKRMQRMHKLGAYEVDKISLSHLTIKDTC